MKRIIPIAEEILSRKGPLTAEGIVLEIRKKKGSGANLICSPKEISNSLRSSKTIEKKGMQTVAYESRQGNSRVALWGMK